jgi:serine/threonine protein kinase
VPFSWTKGELIGIGAFGRVFSALNNVTGELVAVKQVSFAKDEALQGRVAEHIKALEAEVEVLKTLQHENIVRYLGTEITEDSLHIFLEYVPGGSIASLLAKFGAFPESVIRVYTAQLLRGLEYLHQKGIMHRDIKGANILIDKHGTVKLADFGASKKIEDLATVGSGSKSIRGTPYWMAPEVIKQTGHGRPADIWSLACTVIEMATGKPPWSSYTAPVAAMFQIASSKDPPPLPEHLSREAKDFLLLCFNRCVGWELPAACLHMLMWVLVQRACVVAAAVMCRSMHTPGGCCSGSQPAGLAVSARCMILA